MDWYLKSAWHEPCTDTNTKLRIETNSNFEKDFFKLMKNAVVGKIMEKVKKNRDIKLLTTNKRRNCSVSRPNYHTKNVFQTNYQQQKWKKQTKKKVKINKPVYLGLSTHEIGKTLMTATGLEPTTTYFVNEHSTI